MAARALAKLNWGINAAVALNQTLISASKYAETGLILDSMSVKMKTQGTQMDAQINARLKVDGSVLRAKINKRACAMRYVVMG